MRWRVKIVSLITIMALAIGLTFALFFKQSKAVPVVLPQFFYIWQQEWSPQVSDAVIRSASRSAGYLFLTHVLRVKGGNLEADIVTPEYTSLSQTGVPLTAAIRGEVSLAGMLAGVRWETVADSINVMVNSLAETARVHSATLEGIQLDYDCPTSKLGDYTRLIRRLREGFPEMKWSITTLPTWLNSGSFRGLVAAVDYYVLQVHSLDKPQSIDDPITISDIRKIRGWMQSASRVDVPFRVALPTYGYRVYFDTLGKFAALSAEGEPLSVPAGYQMRQAMADFAEMAGVVRDIQQHPIKQCTGIVWYRLPVASDRLNWSWPALAAVMDGREPQVSYAAEVRKPQPGLYEVWVRNNGEAEYPGEVRICIDNRNSRILAYDLINGYKEAADRDSGEQILTGPAPRLDSPIMAAWYRMQDNTERISAERVEVTK